MNKILFLISSSCPFVGISLCFFRWTFLKSDADAAVDGKKGAGDVFGGGGTEIDGGVADVVGLAQVVYRRSLQDALGSGGVAVEGFTHHRTVDPAGSDGVYTYAVWRPFQSHHAHHAEEGALGGGVGNDLRNGEQRGG